MNKFNSLKKIKIPIIQRDYVQARENDEKAEEVIEKFLDDLFDSLKNNKNFHLDFIYGYKENEWFIPIDGQQRLTTLYLLHYYFSKKENKSMESELTYETRTSSREFLEFVKNLELNFEEKISLQIKKDKNFNPYWENDPTIKSMLKVLDKIDEKAKIFNIAYADLKNITFEIFEMEDFGEVQAEELYRKMNSRGKLLTPFENFKSIFEKIAFSKSKDKYKEIAEKFEKNWINHFWDGKNIDRVDEYIMNFIYFITEMRKYDTKYELEKNENFKSFIFLEKFYFDEENFEFFEKVFDNLDTIKQLSKKVEDEFIFFDADKKVNLFEEVIYNKINLIHKTLFYLLILSLNKNYVLDLLRIIRNVLHRQRKLGTGKLIYAQTVDVEYIIELLPYLKKLIDNNPYDNLKNINSEKFSHEKDKIKYLDKKEKLFSLEDYRYIKGDLRLLLSVCDFDNLYKFVIEDEIFEDNKLNSTLRAMLSIGDYSIWIGSVKRGSKWFFGEKGYMEILLTYNTKSKKNEEVYKIFFEKLRIKNVDEVIEDFIQSCQNKEKDWLYYFVKYSVILANEYGLKNLFGWMKYNEEQKDENNFAIEKLEKETKITNRHINVYLLALLQELNKKIDFNKLEFDEDYGYTLKYGKYIKLNVDLKEIVYKGKSYKIFEKMDFIEEIKNETFI